MTTQDPPPLGSGRPPAGADGRAEPPLEVSGPSDSLAFEPVKRRPRRRRRVYSWVILFIGLVGAGAAAWVHWGAPFGGGKSDSVPLITAEATPVKVKPEQPGGLDIPNQDKLVYERLEGEPPPPRTENLLPRPEAPMQPPVSPESAKIDTQPANGPDAVPGTGPAAPATPPVAPQVSAATVPTTDHPTPQEVDAAQKPPPPPPPPDQAAAARSQALAATETYRVQLASVRSEDAARNEWGRLKSKYPELLGGLELTVARADLGSKGIFFRLRAGPLSEDAAKHLCSELSKNKLGCLVIRPGS